MDAPPICGVGGVGEWRQCPVVMRRTRCAVAITAGTTFFFFFFCLMISAGALRFFLQVVTGTTGNHISESESRRR